MVELVKREYVINGAENRAISIDVQFEKSVKKKPVIIFSHGFKGFKDWGHFNLVAQEFAKSGYLFVKYNFSHNGTTVNNQVEITELDAFGKNNFSLELFDLGCVIDFIVSTENLAEEIDSDKLFLIGHSRGGAITLLKVAEDSRIKKAITWASISDTEKRMNPSNLKEWKEKGVLYIENSRTGQQLPLYYQLRENYYANEYRLNLACACTRIKIDVLIIHGNNDNSVSVQDAHELHSTINNSKLLLIKNADHSFGSKHPWNSPELPLMAAFVIDRTINFLT